MTNEIFPGKLIPLHQRITEKAIIKIEQLLANNNYINIATNCSDSRIDSEEWIKIFQRELLYLYRWAKFRFILQKKFAENSYYHNKIVISLMPRHGLTVHFIRRVLVFALLNIKIEVGFDNTVFNEGYYIFQKFNDYFEINDYCFCSSQKNTIKIEEFNNKDNTLIVTGSANTISHLKNKWQGKFIGCGGCCSILLSDNLNLTKKLYNTLSKHNSANSCTNLNDIFILHNKEWYIYNPYKISLEKINNLQEKIIGLHPTIIYNHISSLNAEYLYNYKITKIDDDGIINSLLGFAQDPKNGWIGDYLI